MTSTGAFVVFVHASSIRLEFNNPLATTGVPAEELNPFELIPMML